MTKSVLRATMLIVASSILPGCMVGPDYERPEIEMPIAWNSPVADGIDSARQRETAWWKNFQDPVLNQLVQRAEQNNYDSRVAVRRIQEAMAQYGVSFGELFPDIDSVASYQRFGTSQNGTNNNVQGFQFPARDLYTFGWEASWEIDLWGRIRRAVEASSADLDATIEDLRDVLVVLQADVASTYVDVRMLEQRVAIVERNIAVRQETLDTVQRRFQAGLVEEIDATQAKGELASAQAEGERMKRLLAVARNRLAVLVGVRPGEIDAMLRSESGVPAPPASLAIGIPTDLLRQRPDIRRAERNLAAATARIGVREADLYPSLSLFGTFTWESDDISNMFEANSEAFGVGPNVRWNIFHGNRIRELISVEDARAQQAHLRYEQAVLGAIEDVENALAGHAHQTRRLGYLEEAVTSAERSVELVDGLYESGVADYLRVLEAQRALLLAEDAQAQTRADLTKNVIALYRAMGGGWILQDSAVAGDVIPEEQRGDPRVVAGDGSQDQSDD